MDTVIGYICGTDWNHELRSSSNGATVYPSIQDVKNHCGETCVIEVELKLRAWVVPQNFVQNYQRIYNL